MLKTTKKIKRLQISIVILTLLLFSITTSATNFTKNPSISPDINILKNSAKFANKKISSLKLGNKIIILDNQSIAEFIYNKIKKDAVLLAPLPIIYFPKEPTSEAKTMISRYSNHIVSINLNRKYSLPSDTTIIDKKSEIKPNSATTLNTINASILHDMGIRGKNIKIAIIDTGIWSQHPDLKGRVIAQKSFVKKIYGYPVDDSDTSDKIGHGTLVAGVIAGNGTENNNYIGVAPEAQIISAKVFYGEENNYIATDAGIIAAVIWSVNEQNADVINLSLGGPAQISDPLLTVIKWAAGEGVIFAVAAGNEGENGRGTMQISTPGVSKYVITAGATDEYGISIESYSSLGPISDMSVKPDVIAPGHVITTSSDSLGGYYEEVRGTSFSAPHVAGAVALLLQTLKDRNIIFKNKYYYLSIIKTVLMNTSKSIGAPDIAEGAGLINVGKAWWILNKMSGNDSIPKIISVLPKKLPAGLSFPWKNKLFLGMRLNFNFTIYTTENVSINIIPIGNISSVFKRTSLEVKIPYTNWEIDYFIPENLTTGYYSGELKFIIDNITVQTIHVEFYLENPRGYILFDLRHTSWLIDSKYGQFRHFYELAEDLGFAVDQVYWSDPPYTYSTLSRYDMVFMPDTASYYTVYSENGTEMGLVSKYITKSEMDALEQYVKSGGSIIFIAMIPTEQDTGNNITNINQFSQRFGVKFEENIISDQPIPAKVLSNTFLGVGGETLPFVGTYLTIDESKAEKLIQVNLFGGSYPVGALYVDESGGFILFTSTNFYFDNWSFEGAYGVSSKEATDVKKFHTSILNVIGFRKNIKISPITKNPKFGDQVAVNITIIDLNYTSFDVFYRDRLGTLKIDTIYRIGPNSYAVIINPRHARDISIIVKVHLADGRNASRAGIIFIEPTEFEPPKISGVVPKNGSEISVDVYNQELLTFVLNISDNFIVLPNITEAYCIFETGLSSGSIPVSINWNISEDKKQATITIYIKTSDILEKVILASRVKIAIGLNIYDINLNVLKVVLNYTIIQANGSSIILITAILFIVLTIILIIAIVFKYQKGERSPKGYYIVGS